MKSNDKFKTLFVTVRCANKAGLQATKSSDGITILERKPVSDVLAVELLGQSPSQYIAHSHYHGTRGQLRIRLTGFGEDQMIDKYKVALYKGLNELWITGNSIDSNLKAANVIKN